MFIMRISFAICTSNEGVYVSDLVHRLWYWLSSPSTELDPHEYEVVILDDCSTDEQTVRTLELAESELGWKVHRRNFEGNFADHKNYLNSLCTGDYIFNLDADEWLPETLLDLLPLIVEANPKVEAYWLPRVNTVDGLTLKDVQKWGWVITSLPGFRQTQSMDETSDEYRLLEAYGLIISNESGVVTYDQPIIQFPDLQMRFYKNVPDIRWEGKVHERLVGFTHFSILPQSPEYAIRHYKDATRQRNQNAHYESLIHKG